MDNPEFRAMAVKLENYYVDDLIYVAKDHNLSERDLRDSLNVYYGVGTGGNDDTSSFVYHYVEHIVDQFNDMTAYNNYNAEDSEGW